MFKHNFIYLFLFVLILSTCVYAQDEQTEKAQLTEQNQQDQTSDVVGQKFSDVMSSKDQYFHPFFSIIFTNTDNVYRSQDERVSDTFVFTAPGFWIAYPPIKEQAVKLSTSGTSAGGIGSGVKRTETNNQFQSYLYYAVDFQKYAKEKENDRQNQTVEGSVQLRLKGGLGFEILGQFKENSRFSGLTSDTDTKEYKSYLQELSIYYELSEKFLARMGLRNFEVDMVEAEDDDQDRIDTAYTLNLGWGISENTRLSFDYSQVRVEYKTGENHSTQQQYIGGIDWRISDKTATSFSIGQSEKDFDDPETSDSKTTTLDFSLDYKMTSKAALGTSISQNTTESETADYKYVKSQSWGLSYNQQFNVKFSGTLNYTNAINESIAASGKVERTNVVINRGMTFTYAFREWMKAEAGGNSSTTESDAEGSDIEVNQVYLGISGGF